MTFSKLHNFVKILKKVLKSLSGHLLLGPNQCTKFDGFVELRSLMLHAKFQNHRPSGSEEEDF